MRRVIKSNYINCHAAKADIKTSYVMLTISLPSHSHSQSHPSQEHYRLAHKKKSNFYIYVVTVIQLRERFLIKVIIFSGKSQNVCRDFRYDSCKNVALKAFIALISPCPSAAFQDDNFCVQCQAGYETFKILELLLQTSLSAMPLCDFQVFTESCGQPRRNVEPNSMTIYFRLRRFLLCVDCRLDGSGL